MAKYIAPIQPLILTEAGAKPTVPNPATIMPTDSRFDNQSDLMVGQLAYNVPDNTWYYRGYSGIYNLLTPTSVTVSDVEVWRSDRIYTAGNTYVSYINESSANEIFHDEALYRARITTTAGESPEDSLYDADTNTDGKWVYQGTSTTSDPTTIENTVYVEDVQIYDNTREGGYIAGEFVSYRNESSLTEQFQTWAIYLADIDIPEGTSPEDDTTNWVWQGTEVTEQITYPTVRISSRLGGLRYISDYKDGDIAIDDLGTGEVYVYSETATEGITPYNKSSSQDGKWLVASKYTLEPNKKTLSVETPTPITLEWNSNYEVETAPSVEELNLILDNSYSAIIPYQDARIYLHIKSKNFPRTFYLENTDNISWLNSTGLSALEADKSYLITATRRGISEFLAEYKVLDTDVMSSSSETITVDSVEVWDNTKAYTAGNTFVSYINAGSADPQFQVEAIYRCDLDTAVGESPETHPAKWIYQGTQVEISSGNTSNTAVQDLTTLKALTGYKNTDSLFVTSENTWYKFDINDDTGIRANDYDAVNNPGSWVKQHSISKAVSEEVHNATAKTTPVDADEIGIWDSVSSALKKVTWANIKATLKTYFEGLFLPLFVTIRTEAGAFTLSESDGNTYIRYTGATDISVTVPNTLNIGQPITIWQAGAGVITLVGDTGVILNGDLKTAGQNKGIQIMKVSDNLFDVIGGVV